MKYILLAFTLLFAACDKPTTPKIAEPQREALDKARDVGQIVQQNADATKQQVEESAE